MLLKNKKGLAWLEFKQLQKFPLLFHGIFLKPCNFNQPNTEKKVQTLFNFSPMLKSRQTHGKKVMWTSNKKVFSCDGLITKKRGLGLLATHADCQAALFYDPSKNAIAVVHCGWRGNVQNIYAETVTSLQEKGSKPENILVCISPSLGPNYSEFIHYRKEFPKSFWKYQIKPNYFNLWDISRDQLLACGILPHHIEIAKICTYSNRLHFFSYRRNKEKGRNGTVIGIRNLQS